MIRVQGGPRHRRRGGGWGGGDSVEEAAWAERDNKATHQCCRPTVAVDDSLVGAGDHVDGGWEEEDSSDEIDRRDFFFKQLSNSRPNIFTFFTFQLVLNLFK